MDVMPFLSKIRRPALRVNAAPVGNDAKDHIRPPKGLLNKCK
jgi:hypothetical protein